jgi:predicted permease
MMGRLMRLWRRTLFYLRRNQFDRELEEEMRFHQMMRAEENRDGGLSAEESRYAAQRQFGNQTLLLEGSREMWAFRWIEILWQDIRYGVRMLMKNPGFTSVAVLTLALGIGANTAIFSVVDAMLLKMLPVKDPAALALFKAIAPREFSAGNYINSYNGLIEADKATGQIALTSFPYQSFQRMREHQPQSALSDIFAFGDVSLNVNANGMVEAASGQAVSGNYYAGLGVKAVLGRTIIDSDDTIAATPVAVLSYRYWRKRFNGNEAIIGQQINLNKAAFTIIGVTPPGFEGAMQAGSTKDITIPIAWEPQLYPGANGSRLKFQGGVGEWWLRLMGRIQPGATAEQARAQLEHVFYQSVLEHYAARQTQAQAAGGGALKDFDPKAYLRLTLAPGGQGEMNVRQRYAPSLYLLLGVVGLVLLIACSNVASLLLSRASARQKEISVRVALGASRFRLLRQLLTESVLLAVVSGATGILFALWLKNGLLAVGDWGPQALEPKLDMRALTFTMSLSLLTGIVFGLVPAWRATRVNLTPALNDSGRGSSAAARSWLSRCLVIAQVALSFVLLFGAGLFVRTLINLQRVEPGFNKRNLLLFGVQPGLLGYQNEKLAQLYQQMAERLEAVPGAQKVTFSNVPLLAGARATARSVYLRGDLSAAPDARGRFKSSGEVYINRVRENFMEAMEIPLLAGRALQPQDDARAPRVVVINQAFARAYFPGQNVIGKRFTNNADKPDEIEIVGLVRDAKYMNQRDEIPPTAYVSWRQEPFNFASFEVRVAGDPMTAVNAVRQAVRDVEPNMPLNNLRTQVEQADQTLAMERLFARLMTLFGLLAQILAAIGLFGVLAYAVSQRTREIGIRMALGAQSRDVVWLILRQGLTLTLIGVAAGVFGALASARVMSGLLYGVTATDLTTFVVITSFLTAVALLACFVPARRAAKVDPIVALRHE